MDTHCFQQENDSFTIPGEARFSVHADPAWPNQTWIWFSPPQRRAKRFAQRATDNSSHGKSITQPVLPHWDLSQPTHGFDSAVLYSAGDVAASMFKLRIGLVGGCGGRVSVGDLCSISGCETTTLDKAKVKQTSDWQLDMFCEHGPTVNYTSQNNCPIYIPQWSIAVSCLWSLTAQDV